MTCICIDDDSLFLRKLEAYIAEIDWLDLKGTFTNPVQAATQIIKEEPDLLFLDIEMPHLDGYAMMDWIMPRLKDLKTMPKIVVISGNEAKMEHENPDVLVHILKTNILEPEHIADPIKVALDQ